MLEIENLACGYGKREVLSGFSATLAEGQIFCLLGPNGVGKTTLFRTVLGLLPRLAGQVRLDGVDILQLTDQQRAQVIAYVPQAHLPPFAFTVHDVVVMGRIARRGTFAAPVPDDHAAASAVLGQLGLLDLEDCIYTELSGGQRQMVLIARALAQQPRILMMDEPTSNLDFGNQVRVLSTVKELARQGLGIFMTTHSPEHVAQCQAQGALLVPDGPPVCGSADKLLTAKNLRRAYGIDCLVMDVSQGGRTVKVCQPIM